MDRRQMRLSDLGAFGLNSRNLKNSTLANSTKIAIKLTVTASRSREIKYYEVCSVRVNFAEKDHKY